MSANRYENHILKNATPLRDFFITLWNLFLYGGFIPALWGPSLLVTSSVFMGIPCQPVTAAISFMLPLTVYAYDYLADLEDDAATNPERCGFISRWGMKLTVTYLLLLIALLICCMNIWMIILSAAMFVTGILYAGFFKGLTERITGFKNIYLGLIWSSWAVTPLFIQNQCFPWPSSLAVFIFIFLKVYINTAFSDYKDIESDSLRGLRTLPVVYGERKSLKVLQIINGVNAAILLSGIFLAGIPLAASPAVVLCLYTALYLHFKESMGTENATLVADLEGPLHLLLLLAVV
ncbi:UbiA family prenyltransferase [Methanothermobacter wolfeii]|uniref:UbiA family prenyltransferase n=1 Tax=Methanothermobacter wolfeii TaxID=145261 RepID=UPI0024B3C181|nr:UbiA family prenyltransferase [Methanothermobacter wolfeii]MDI6702296.1 UbiA family prenyltransferase [Methanothermobacter wolfeii]MDI6842310.1 UbiA family prenyltransferase [Methanothermobacter wolfeii]